MAEDVIKEDIAQDEADEAETQVYEVGFHIVPSVEEGDLASEVDSIKSLIEKNGGVFISEEFPKLIDLAYTIVKGIEGKKERFDTAYFGWIKFIMHPSAIESLKKVIDSNNNILWLTANDLSASLSDGASVTSWADISGNSVRSAGGQRLPRDHFVLGQVASKHFHIGK